MKRLKPLEWHDGLVVDDQAWAWWPLADQLSTPGWAFLSDGERMWRHLRLTAVFAAIRSGEVHLVEWQRPTSVVDWMNQVQADARAGHPVEWLDAALDGCCAHLGGVQRYAPWTAIGVRVDDEPVDVLRADHRRVRPWITERLEQVRTRLTPARWERWIARADAYGQLLGDTGARRLTDAELAWLCTHPEQRGHPDWDLPDRAPLGHTRIVRDGTLLRYEHPAGDRWAMWLTATLPEDLTGHEWLTLHRGVEFPVDVSVRAKVVAPPDAAQAAEAAGVRAAAHASYLTDMRRAIPPGLWAQIDGLPAVADAIRRGRLPAIRAAVRWCVWADTKADLLTRGARLREVYADAGISLHQPAGVEQPRLDLEALPASSARHPAWTELMPAGTFAASAFGLDPTVGHAGGPYIGQDLTRGGAPVGFDPLAAAGENTSTAVAMLGVLGGGKTLASLIMSTWAWLRGADIIDVDPKGDTERIHTILPPGAVQTITYGTGAVPGSADPFVVCADSVKIDPATTAADIIALLIPDSEWDTHRTAIITACNTERDQATGRRPATLTGVVDRLRTTAPAVALSLDAARGLPIASALFASTDTIVEPFATTGRWTRIAFAGLRLDDVDRSNRLQAAVTTALLVAVGAAITAHCFAPGTRRRPKLVRWDEAHRIRSSATGAAALELMVREGRAFNVALLLISHDWADFPDVVRKLTSAIFVFRTPHQAPAREFCHALGIEEHHAEVLQTMPKGGGHALFRDPAGAVAHIRFDPVFADWLAAFDTNPHTATDTQPTPPATATSTGGEAAA